MLRIAHFVTHPIQYFAPLYRAIVQMPDVTLTVWFGSSFGTTPSLDPGLGVTVRYDADLTGGFEHRFLVNRGDGVPGPNENSFDCPTLDRLLDPTSVDVVWIHGWGYKFQHQAASWAKQNRIPYVVRGESTLIEAPKWSLRWMRRFVKFAGFCRRADGCLYVGQQNRRFYRTLGVSPQRLFPAHYSIDAQDFIDRSRLNESDSVHCRSSIRKSFGAGDQEVVVATVCKLVERKRVTDLIHAIAISDKNVRLWVIGSGQEESKLRSLADSVASDRVRFLGFKNQSEIPRILAAADLFALASSEETWGLVVNEAMACGLAAIVSDRCGCTEDLIRKDETGGTFRCGDVSAMAALINHYAKSPDVRHRQGQNALAHVRDGYGISTTSKQMVTALRQIVVNRPI